MLTLFAGGFLKPNQIFAQERPAVSARTVITKNGVTFVLEANGDGLRGRFCAPASGWLAVGFNRAPRLAGTRFLIAALTAQGPLYEEHIAMPPDHQQIQLLGGNPAFANVSIRANSGKRELGFTVRRFEGAPYELDLAAGRAVTLMLAWSHDTDFNHHSTWRQQFSISV